MQFSRRTFAMSLASTPFVFHPLARAQDATPTSSDIAPASDRISDLMQFVPDEDLDSELSPIWNDYERQVAALRAAHTDETTDIDDGELASTSQYSVPPFFLQYAESLEEATGFTMNQVLQSMEVGYHPDSYTFYKLDDDPEFLVPFWESVEYQQLENNYGTFWSLSEEPTASATHPVQKLLVTRHNNVAVLPGNVLAFASSSELLEKVMSTAAGDTANRIAAFENITAEIPDDANSAVYVDGAMFDFGWLFGSIEEEAYVQELKDSLTHSDEEVGPMPVVHTGATTISAGASYNESLHNPDTLESLILEVEGSGAAQQAAEVVAWRVENLENNMASKTPFTEYFPDIEIEVGDETHLRISRSVGSNEPLYRFLMENRILLPFMFRTDE